MELGRWGKEGRKNRQEVGRRNEEKTKRNRSYQFINNRIGGIMLPKLKETHMYISKLSSHSSSNPPSISSQCKRHPIHAISHQHSLFRTPPMIIQLSSLSPSSLPHLPPSSRSSVFNRTSKPQRTPPLLRVPPAEHMLHQSFRSHKLHAQLCERDGRAWFSVEMAFYAVVY